MENEKINKSDLKEILEEYEASKHYEAGLTPQTFIALREAGAIEDIININKDIFISQEKKGSAAEAGLEKLRNRIENPNNYICASTGFNEIDKLLDGGLYAGLYVIGAISSLGKTSFAINLADNIAQTGRKVIYISLEMAEEEIIAKSISRLTLKESINIAGANFAKDTRHILNGKLWENYTKDEKQVIENAIEDYKEYANNIFIYEGVGNFNAEDIRQIIDKHTDRQELPPVVIVDYLQILAPLKENITDAKKNMDLQIVELKRISRDYNLPLLAISSFNRSSYNEGVSFSALKESGAIEYTADVVIGLQYENIEAVVNDEEKTDKQQKIAIKKIIEENEEKAYKGESQNIQVKLLKNRNGVKGSAYISYFPKYNYFTEN